MYLTGAKLKKLWECHKIKICAGICYMFCLLNVLGITTNTKYWKVETVISKETVETEGTVRTQSQVEAEEDKATEEAPRVALTFDDGPSKICTGRLLDGLMERDVKATFFVIGENAEASPELVKRIYEEGHLIGNHTYHHVEITKVSDEKAKEEIRKTDEAVYHIIGKHIEYVRPPFGAWQKELEKSLDVLPVMWTIDPLDWTTENVDEIVNKVVTEVDENDIILLHDCYDSSVDAALRIVDILKKKGYRFVTVDELIMD